MAQVCCQGKSALCRVQTSNNTCVGVESQLHWVQDRAQWAPGPSEETQEPQHQPAHNDYGLQITDESLLTFNNVAWYGHLSVKQKNTLAHIVNQAGKIIEHKQHQLSNLYFDFNKKGITCLSSSHSSPSLCFPAAAIRTETCSPNGKEKWLQAVIHSISCDHP